MKLRSFIAAFLALTFMLPSASVGFGSADGIMCSAEKNRAPDFVVTDTDGNDVTLSQFFGKPIVLNFWATWCMPCVYELPDFEEAFREYGDRVVFMMINQTNGYSDTFQGVKDYAEICGFTFPLYFDTESSAMHFRLRCSSTVTETFICPISAYWAGMRLKSISKCCYKRFLCGGLKVTRRKCFYDRDHCAAGFSAALHMDGCCVSRYFCGVCRRYHI